MSRFCARVNFKPRFGDIGSDPKRTVQAVEDECDRVISMRLDLKEFRVNKICDIKEI